MLIYIASYVLKALIICWAYTVSLGYQFSLLALVIELVAIWWLLDNFIVPLFMPNEREKLFSRIFSVDILNICIGIYYIIGGLIMYFMYSPWDALKSTFMKITTLAIFLIAYNKIYYAILSVGSKQIAEGFCSCSM